MSRKFRPQYADRGTVVKVIDSLRVGCTFGYCTTLPSAVKGFAPGCIMLDINAAGGAQVCVNEGTLASCTFVAVATISSGTFTTLTATTANITTGNITNAALANAAITNGSIAAGGTMTLGNLTNFSLGSGSGTRVGVTNGDKLGLWGVTPVIQPATTGESAGVGAGNGSTNANLANVNFTGNSGSTAYTIGDMVKALKAVGILKV